MKLPKYEAIWGKPWLDRWNPEIDWKRNVLKWTVGSRVVEIAGLQNPSKMTDCSNLFQYGSYCEEIFAQRMRQIARKEPIFIALIR